MVVIVVCAMSGNGSHRPKLERGCNAYLSLAEWCASRKRTSIFEFLKGVVFFEDVGVGNLGGVLGFDLGFCGGGSVDVLHGGVVVLGHACVAGRWVSRRARRMAALRQGTSSWNAFGD